MDKVILTPIDGKNWTMNSYDGIRTFTANANGTALKVGDLVVLEPTQDYDAVPKVRRGNTIASENYIVISKDVRYGKNLVTVLCEGIIDNNDTDFVPGAYYAEVNSGTTRLTTNVTSLFMGIAISKRQMWVNPRVIHDEAADFSALDEQINDEGGIEDRLADVETQINEETVGIEDRLVALDEQINEETTGIDDRLTDVENFVGPNEIGGNLFDAMADIASLEGENVINSFEVELELIETPAYINAISDYGDFETDGAMNVVAASTTTNVLSDIEENLEGDKLAIDGSKPFIKFFTSDKTTEETGTLETGDFLRIVSSNESKVRWIEITVAA